MGEPQPRSHLRKDLHTCFGHGHPNAGSPFVWLETILVGAGVIRDSEGSETRVANFGAEGP